MKKAILTITAVVLMASGMASAVSLTGEAGADGWSYAGNSLSNGTYVRGSENIGFDVYTTYFTVTDSSVFDLSGHDDASYLSYYETTHWTKANARTWEVGQTVLGIGGTFSDITAAEAGWDAFSGKAVNSTIDNEYRLRLQAKIGSSAATWSTSTVAPGLGTGSGSTGSGGAGAFLVRTSGWHSLAAWENFAGTMLGLQKTSHIDGYGQVDVARVIWTWDEIANRPASWELLLNISLLEQDYAAAGFTGALPGLLGDSVIASVQIASAGYTDALATVVPEPTMMTLLGLGSVVALLRRRK